MIFPNIPPTQWSSQATGQQTTSIPKMLPAHGPAYQEQTAANALNYIGSNAIYVFVFFFLVLVMIWTIGSKGTFWFLVLVLAGQLLFNVNEIQSLLKG